MVRVLHLSFPVIIGLAIASAAAQSFDCAKATEPAEKFVCANKELSAADEKMAAAFKAAMSQLSDEGKRRLIESQRSWIRYDRNTSPLNADGLKSTYSERISELEKALQPAGPFKIQWLTMYKTTAEQAVKKQGAQKQGTPADDDDEDTSGSVVFSFPRIDSPSTADTQKWNRLVEAHVREMVGQPDSGTELTARCDITYVAPEVISLSLGMGTFNRRAAHPNHSIQGYIVLVKGARELQALDLFNAKTSWKTFLDGIVFRKLKAQAAKEDWELNISSPTELNADKVARWTLEKQGLKFSFSSYDVSAYVFGDHEVVVSWRELKPYLNPNAPFPVPLQ